MARCACGNNSCSCIITADEGITVEGNGTPARPYKIGLESEGQLSSILQVSSTPTLQLISSGSGIPTDKFDIRGVARQALTELRDVADPEGPQVGDVPIWMGNHWEFRPPVAAAPGTVATSDGLSGDGSAPNPLKVRFSGTWPLANFTAGQDILSGDEVYRDSAGNLRSKPQIITVARPVTDLPQTYPIGTTVMSVDATSGANWPAAGLCEVVTHRKTEQAAVQWCFTNSPTAASAWLRSGDSTGWSPWRELIGPAIPAPVYKTAGGDLTLAITTTGNVELSTTMRCTIANPSKTRRLLVTAKSYGQMQISGATAAAAAWAQTVVVSGAPVEALPRGENRINTALGFSDITESVYTECEFWVPINGTLVTTLGGRKSGATAICRGGYVEALIPRRFE